MTQVQGHSIEEQWDLSMQFDAMVEHAMYQTVETYISLATGKVLAAAAGFNDTPSIQTIWQKQVDTSLASFLYATFESAALNVAHGVVNDADIPAGMGVPLVADDHVAHYVSQVANKMVGISDELWQDINVALQQGVQLGESIDELADRVRTAGSVATSRGRAVARTTVVQASNAGSLAQAQVLGDDSVTKQWLATEDMRTRHDHTVADGQKRPLNQAFDVGGWPMQYPGDPAGPADEVINCRCTLTYNFDTPPAYVCDCASADTLVAAPYLSTPMTVPASSCVCPVTESLNPPGYISPLAEYGKLAQKGIYDAFQKPSKISPAYGGAKIHKQMQPIKDALSLTDADTSTLLNIIDQQYALAGGKSSFKEKYEEWLNSPAGKKVVKIPMHAPSPIGLAPPPPVTTAVSAPTTFTARGLSVIPQPNLDDLKFIKAAGGTHGAAVYEDVKTGERWIFKSMPYGKDYVAKLEQTTAKLQSMSGLQQPSIYTVRMNGKYGSLQSMHDGVDAWPHGSDFKVLKLSADDILEIQREQIFDWFIGNPDAHTGNFLRLSNGHLVGIDKGAGFKTLKEKTLDWKTEYDHLPSTKLVYKELWQAYADGKNVTLFDPSTGVLKDLTDQIMAIPDAQYITYIRPFAEQALKDGKLPFNDIDKFLKAAVDRKNNLAKDFQSMYDRAVAERAKHLTPPVSAPVAPPVASVVTPAFAPVTPSFTSVIADWKKIDHGILENTIKDINYGLTKGKSFDELWAAKQPYIKDLPHFANLTSEQRYELVKQYGKYYPKVKITHWPAVINPVTAPVATAPTINIAGLVDKFLSSPNAVSDKHILDNALYEVNYKFTHGITPHTALDNIWASSDVLDLKKIPQLDGLSNEEMMSFLKEYAHQTGVKYDVDKWPAALGPNTTPAAATVTTAVPTTSAELLDQLEPLLITHDQIQIQVGLQELYFGVKKGKSFADLWNSGVASDMKNIPAFAGLTDDQLIGVLKEYSKKKGFVYDTSAWPDTLGGVPATAPTIVVPATATTPATIDLLDISTATHTQKQELLKAFKAIKPVTPNWGGSAIMKTLQEAKKSLGPDFAKFNDGQLLKMLDAAGKPGVKTFFDEASTWLKTPAGKKYAVDAGVPAVPTTAPGTGLATISDAVKNDILKQFQAPGHGVLGTDDEIWNTVQSIKKSVSGTGLTEAQIADIIDEQVSVSAGVTNKHVLKAKIDKIASTKVTGGVTSSLGDISGIDKVIKQQVFTGAKSYGTYLSSPPSVIWDNLQKFKSATTHKHLNDLQILRILDELNAEKLGVVNANLYEKKIVEWMKTKAGQDHMAGLTPAAKKVAKAAKKTAKKAYPSYSPPTPTPVSPIPPDVVDIPRNISTTEHTFEEISNRDALALQNTYTPWTPGQRTSLRYYTTNNWHKMNDPLREGMSTSDAVIRHIKNSQAGMRPSTRPMLLRRGTNLDQVGLARYGSFADAEKLVGKTLEDKGFMSTSVGPRAAFGGNLLLEIEAPTGTPMAFVDHISAHPGENEMLLAAGTRYKVLSVTQEGSKTIMRIRIIP